MKMKSHFLYEESISNDAVIFGPLILSKEWEYEETTAYPEKDSEKQE